MLAGLLMNMPIETLQQIHADILECSLAISLKGNYRHKLKEKRQTSKGNLKKIYAALYHAKPHELQNMADTMAETIVKTSNKRP